MRVERFAKPLQLWYLQWCILAADLYRMLRKIGEGLGEADGKPVLTLRELGQLCNAIFAIDFRRPKVRFQQGISGSYRSLRNSKNAKFIFPENKTIPERADSEAIWGEWRKLNLIVFCTIAGAL